MLRSLLMRLPPFEPEVDAVGLHAVDLIRRSSWDAVLSDVAAGALERTGDLLITLMGPGFPDRERSLASAALTPSAAWPDAGAKLLLIFFLPKQEPSERVSGFPPVPLTLRQRRSQLDSEKLRRNLHDFRPD